MFCLLGACGSDAGENPENREIMIKEVTDLPDAEIKIPATLIGDELAEVPIIGEDYSSGPLSDNTDLPEEDEDTEGSDQTDASFPPEGETGSTDSAPADSGEYGKLDDDNNITYNLDGETRAQILNDLATDIQESIEAVLADKFYYPNVSDIVVNSDCTEFTIYLTTDSPNIYESMLMMSFYTVGDRYQIYNGVDMENAKTTVIYVNANTGIELAKTNSTTVQ